MSLDLVITRTKQGILLIFFFQKKKDIRRQWIQVKRADLQPTEHSIICGAHFAHECFEDDAMVKMGLKDKKSNLKRDSVPTIQPQRPDALSEARKLADYGERGKRNTGDCESHSRQKVTNKSSCAKVISF